MAANMIIAIVAGIQAIFTVVLVLVYIRRQTKIMKDQQILSFWSEYAALSYTREQFWTWLRAEDIHKYFLGTANEPVRIDEALEQSGFPPEFDPAKERNLSEFVGECESAGTWKGLPLWSFAKRVYSEWGEFINKTVILGDKEKELERLGNIHKQFHNVIDKARGELAYFWNKWASVLDFGEYPEPDLKELVILTWLELALAWKTKDSRRGKREFFRLAFNLAKEAGLKPFDDVS
ncbi:hypothetical protein FJZ33_00435 [Candidatus Poribacteria bacterium]|nr:hypothetical protein [Candidatus Poribacteria bacterium]